MIWYIHQRLPKNDGPLNEKKNRNIPFSFVKFKKNAELQSSFSAGWLLGDWRKKEIFLFSVADQNFKGGEGKLMQLGWTYSVFMAFQKPWQNSGNTCIANTSSYRKKICFSFCSIILSVYLLRLYQSLNYQVL